MDHDKKLSFIASMTDKALQHVAVTPNTVSPKGSMSHEKMLSFVTAMTRHGLEHFADGGTSAGGLLGGVSSFLGTNNNFNPTGANITPGTNGGQLEDAYTNAGNALSSQNSITNTLNTGLNQGAGNQATLSNMYLNQAEGRGPNPALAALNQSTGENISQQAALQAGQRGAGGNAGAVAANAARAGGAIQQQAAGQAATQQAQQQLAAEQNLQNLSANQIAQGTGATQTLNSASQNEQNILQGANTAANNANVANQSNLNNVNASVATGNQSAAGNVLGGLAGIGSAIPAIASIFYEGGEVTKDKKKVELPPMIKKPVRMAAGGITGQQTTGPQSYAGQWLNSTVDTQGPQAVQAANVNTQIASPFGFLSNIKASPQTSAGPQAPLPGSDSSDYASLSNYGSGNNVNDYTSLKSGGKVKAPMPGEKAVKKGDSLDNDKVPALLSEGEIVIPRHITMGPNAPAQAALFVAKELKKRAK